MSHPDEPLPEEANEDIVVMSRGEESTICPITKQELVEPMKRYGLWRLHGRSIILLVTILLTFV